MYINLQNDKSELKLARIILLDSNERLKMLGFLIGLQL